jgi:photosystem II stability/assembly factor-like uncharacterized protein
MIIDPLLPERAVGRGLLAGLRLHRCVVQRSVATLAVAFLVALAARSEVVGVEVGVWVSNGPTSGAIRSLALDPQDSNRLYAGSGRGTIFRSSDAGQNWSSVALPFTGQLPEIRTLRVDTHTPSVVYAGTSTGVFKSSDAGSSWAATRLANIEVHDLAIDPLTSSTLYAATSADRLYRSTDSGATWLALAELLRNRAVMAVAVDPLTPTVVYAGTERGRVFRSTDRGTTWNVPGFEGIGANQFRQLLIDSTTTTTLYAACERGVFKSTNSGAAWEAVNLGLQSTDVTAVALDPSDPAILYAWSNGVYRSTDAGGRWQPTGLVTSGQALAIDSNAPAVLYGGGDGVARTADAGRTWAPVNRGLGDAVVTALAVDPDTASIYAGGIDVFESLDDGESWRALHADLPSLVTALVIAPGNPTATYAGTSLGVYKRVGEGRWSSASPRRLITALAVDPTRSSTLYAGTGDQGMLKTTNGGTQWRRANDRLTEGTFVLTVLVDPISPGIVYIGTRRSASGTAFRSMNGGTSWETMPIPMVDGLRPDVLSLAGDPKESGRLYAGTSRGLFRSSDGGSSWGVDVLEGRSVDALAIDPKRPNKVYVGTSTGVFKSTDQGETWEALNDGLTTGSITALAVNPFQTTTIYAATAGRGVFTNVQSPPCHGDCNADSEVTVDELLIMVNLALGTSVAPCPAGDVDGDGFVTIDEILLAVNNSLFACAAS